MSLSIHQLRVPCRRAFQDWLIPWMVLAATGCADPTAGVGPQPSHGVGAAGDPLGPAAALVAIDDAIGRVLPALASGGSTVALQRGLSQVANQLRREGGTGLNRALADTEKALRKYQQHARPEFHPDVDAVSLALAAVSELP